jgi:hypothetical protein
LPGFGAGVGDVALHDAAGTREWRLENGNWKIGKEREDNAEALRAQRVRREEKCKRLA